MAGICILPTQTFRVAGVCTLPTQTFRVAGVCILPTQTFRVAGVLARAKRERVVQDEVEKANRRPTRPTRPDTAPRKAICETDAKYLESFLGDRLLQHLTFPIDDFEAGFLQRTASNGLFIDENAQC